MGHSLEQFSAECHRILKQDPGVEGRKKYARWSAMY